jgi:hypothetical protein
MKRDFSDIFYAAENGFFMNQQNHINENNFFARFSAGAHTLRDSQFNAQFFYGFLFYLIFSSFSLSLTFHVFVVVIATKSTQKNVA